LAVALEIIYIMKITPLEIKKKTFEKQIRGYDKEEVNAFLLSLSHEWENALEKIKALEVQLKKSEQDVNKLREVEASLYKTLKTAEDTGANMIDQAKKTAELHLKETQMNADALLNESKSRARNIIDDAELNSKQILEGMDIELKELARVYSSLEDHRDNVLNELTNLSTITLQRVQKVSDNLKHFDLDKRLQEIKVEVTGEVPPRQVKTNPPVIVNTIHEEEMEEDLIDEPENSQELENNSSSFFDELDD